MTSIRTVRRLTSILLAFAAYNLTPSIAAADLALPDHIPPLAPTADMNPLVAADVASKGYHISELRNGFYWITDGKYQSMAIVTCEGVILVDAPEPLPFFPPMPVLQALREVTNAPVTHLIYSHGHSDHIAGAGEILAAFPNVEIIAQEETKQLLLRENDPKRPIPTRTFRDALRLNVGGKRLNLSYHGNTHTEGNIFIYAPREKILMVVDVVFPGWVPFRRLALSTDIAGWIRGNDQVLQFPFETLISGHLGRLGTRADVRVQLQYVRDIVESTEEIMLDANTLFDGAAAMDSAYGAGTAFTPAATWTLFGAFYDSSVAHCTAVLNAKYIEGAYPGANPTALGGAEAFNFSNCDAYFDARRLGVH